MPNSKIAALLLVGGALVGSGCATKKYVKQSVDPVSNKVDQVATQTNQQGQTLEATRRDVDKNQQDISATRETARAADARAGDAMNAANAAGAKADKNARDLSELRNTVANLDDFKPASTVIVPFSFNKFVLSTEGKSELDRIAQGKDQWKRYFITVEGFTDKVGSDSYNDTLSRRRADKVVQYLVSKYDIPVFRIHQIGLGKDKPVDEGRGRNARAKNRRVEVTVYTAEAGLAATAQANTGAAAQ